MDRGTGFHGHMDLRLHTPMLADPVESFFAGFKSVFVRLFFAFVAPLAGAAVCHQSLAVDFHSGSSDPGFHLHLGRFGRVVSGRFAFAAPLVHVRFLLHSGAQPEDQFLRGFHGERCVLQSDLFWGGAMDSGEPYLRHLRGAVLDAASDCSATRARGGVGG